MPPTTPAPATLRRLAEMRPEHGRVLSVYLDLDPSEFATAEARSTAVTSLLDEARKAVEACSADLPHAEAKALKEDLERARQHLEGDLPADGAQGVALFVCEPAGLDEVLALPTPVPTQVAIDGAPVVQPLLSASPVRWCVLLVNRRQARIFEGTSDRLDEVQAFESDVQNQHQQGGWSQARYERSVEEDVREHLQDVAEVVRRRYGRGRRWQRLLIGCPAEQRGQVEAALPDPVARALTGWLEIDVSDSAPDDVAEVARVKMQEEDVRVEAERLAKLREELGQDDRGAAGVPGVADALNQQKVETLLIEQGHSLPGGRCPQCGLLYPQDVGTCPLDQAAVERRDDILEPMAEAALLQDAEVLVVRNHPDLGSLGGVAAILRY